MREEGWLDSSFAGVIGPDCGDLDGDERQEMVVARRSVGSAGTLGWAVMSAREDGEWRVEHLQDGVTHVGVRISGARIHEATPIYRADDPNCCPSGGWRTRIYGFRDGQVSKEGEETQAGTRPPSGYGFGGS
jgi:hypothetical protein